MSRFLDRLDRITRGAPVSIGFGAASRSEKLPSMGLLGRLSDRSKALRGASLLAKIGAEGALIEGMDDEADVSELAQNLKDVPWGGRVGELNAEQVSSYTGKGCDFLVFEPEKVLLDSLGDEDTAYLLYIRPDVDEGYLRGVEGLPIDAVLLDTDGMHPPLTLQHLITISSVRSMMSKYLLLQTRGDLTERELEALRDVGVDGLVVDVPAFSVKKLEGLREKLLSLPRRQRDRAAKRSAVLPAAAYSAADVASDDEE
jgi:hypothetical protein